MRVDSSASLWINATLVGIERGHWEHFADCGDFKVAMIVAFEPVTEIEEAWKQLWALHQTRKLAVYIAKLKEL